MPAWQNDPVHGCVEDALDSACLVGEALVVQGAPECATPSGVAKPAQGTDRTTHSGIFPFDVVGLADSSPSARPAAAIGVSQNSIHPRLSTANQSRDDAVDPPPPVECTWRPIHTQLPLPRITRLFWDPIQRVRSSCCLGGRCRPIDVQGPTMHLCGCSPNHVGVAIPDRSSGRCRIGTGGLAHTGSLYIE